MRIKGNEHFDFKRDFDRFTVPTQQPSPYSRNIRLIKIYCTLIVEHVMVYKKTYVQHFLEICYFRRKITEHKIFHLFVEISFYSVILKYVSVSLKIDKIYKMYIIIPNLNKK